MDNQILWDRFKAGDRQSLAHIYEENVDFLYNYGRHMTQDEDLILDQIQDLFVYIWDNKHKLSTPTSIKAYLLRAFKNRLIDFFRKNKRMNTDGDLSKVSSSVDSMEDEIIGFETTAINNQKLSTAMEKLTSKQKEIIYLKYTKNVSYEEIGEILDINYQSVRNLAHRAMVVLRKEILLLIFMLNY